MIDLVSILDQIITLLNQKNTDNDTLYPVFVRKNQQEHAKDDPGYPFGVINISTPYTQQTDTRSEETTEYDEQADELNFIRRERPNITISLDVYSKDEDQAISMNQNVIGLFKHILYDELSSRDIIVVEVTGVSDRTGLLEVEYEYRHGFDVVLRVTSELSYEIPYADTITGEINGEPFTINL